MYDMLITCKELHWVTIGNTCFSVGETKSEVISFQLIPISCAGEKKDNLAEAPSSRHLSDIFLHVEGICFKRSLTPLNSPECCFLHFCNLHRPFEIN